nr:O-antigen ligase family protein [uncultured Devosia sp.]
MAIGVLMFFFGPFFSGRLYMDFRWAVKSCRTTITLVITLFVWRIFTAFVGETPEASIVLTVLEFIVISGIFFSGVMVAGRKGGREIIANALFLSFATLVAVALFEMTTGVNVGAILVSMSDMQDSLAQMMGLSQVRDGQFRIRSLSAHSILLGQFLGALLPFMAVQFFTHPRTSVRVSALLLICAAPAVIFATRARSGLIALAVSILVYVTLRVLFARVSKSTKLALIALTAIFIVLLYSSAADSIFMLVQGRSEIEMSSSVVRDEMISKGIVAVEGSPIWGFGQGRSVRHAGVVNFDGSLSIDNFYLSRLLDFGFVGLALEIGLFVSIVLLGFRAAGLLAEPAERGVALAGVAAVISILVGQYVISSWDNQVIVFLFAAYFGGALIESKRLRAEELASLSQVPQLAVT